MSEPSIDTETRYGPMTVLSNPEDIVSRFLLEYGEWSEFEVEFVANHLTAGARVADVGAFVGSFGIALSQRVALDRICFVEANPAIIPHLRKNLTRNCRASHEIVDAIICPDGQKIRSVSRIGDNQGSTSYILHTVSLQEDSQFVSDAFLPENSVSLRDLLDQNGPFDLLKLDIEGLEHEVLKDIKEQLARETPIIWAECNEAFSSLDLAELLLSCKRQVYYFAYPAFNPNNIKGNKDAIFPMAYEAGLLALHGQPQMPDDLVKAGCLLHRITDSESLKRALWRTPRWCPAAILADRPEESLAIAIRYLTGDQFGKFLTRFDNDRDAADPATRQLATPLALAETLEHVETELRLQISERDRLQFELDQAGTLLQNERERLSGFQAELSKLAETLANDRENYTTTVEQLTVQLNQEREQRSRQVRLAEWAEALANDRLNLLRAEHRYHREWQQRAVLAEQNAASRALELERLLARRSLRATNAMVRTFIRLPKGYRAMHVLWAISRRVVRYIRPRP